MKLEITKQVEVSETIDVELPFYCKEDYAHADRNIDIVYGKIEETKTSHITIQQIGDDYCVRLKILDCLKLEFSTVSNLLKDKYKSNKEEFEAAKKEAIEFLAKM